MSQDQTTQEKQSLFKKEERILSHALKILAGDSASIMSLANELDKMTSAYRKLLRKVKSLTKVSDRLQRQIRTYSRELDNELGRHVGWEIKQEILKSSGRPEQIKMQNLTIAFMDLRGFTAFSEHMPPDRTIAFLKNYYEFSLEIVHRHGGFVKSFMGDGVMLVFGYGKEVFSADAALAFGLEIVEGMKEFNRLNGADFRLGIGFHAGPTAAGNIGNQDRTEFAVIGNTVNMAARVEALTKDLKTPILFTEEVMTILHHPPREPHFVANTRLRGQVNPVNVYTLKGFEDLYI